MGAVEIRYLDSVVRKDKKEEETSEFLQVLPHMYYEENNLHGMVIEQIKDFDTCIKEVDRFLSYLENDRLDVWIHNKIIQKAVESYRITKEQKEYLKSLKKK